MSERADKPPVLCFGEMLWDSLPQALFPGGAPMNVAYHLKQLGRRPLPVSAVGGDVLGEELLRRLRDWRLKTKLIRVLPDKPTGLVRVTLREGSPSYEILEDVAWDWITLPNPFPPAVAQAAALVFGSLAQREEHNRRQFAGLLKHCPDALRVFDVNLRPPFDSAELVWSLARHANVIKLNDEEARRLMGRDYPTEELERAARDLAAKSDCDRICITAGAKGAGLLMNGEWTWAQSSPVKVKDTVGAGDSFTAALINGLLQKDLSPDEILSRACRLAGFVASSEGATPAYEVSSSGEVRAR